MGVTLHNTINARTWASEFCRITGFQDEDLMMGWFAHAIMTGYDKAIGVPINGDHAQDVLNDVE